MLGQSIGKYRITKLLGQGGMGAVYAAQHETINQRVAIKVLHPKLTSDESSVQRFMHEARTTSLVHHPGLVKVHDFGQLPDGAAYMMMEYLEGESLRSRLAKRGKLDSKDALRIVRQLAAALAVAHEKGVIHRDLKPDNVFLVPDSETQAGERTKILDFGIAKVVDPEAGEVMKTTTGAIVGTPIYMSPEQCRGGIAVTDRTDVYSLGIILYQMLAGSPPFSGTGAGDLIAQHIVDPPKPLHEVAPQVATEVETLVHKMLAKKPEDRPSMKQILGELEQLGLGSTGTGAQVVIVPPPPQPPAPRSPLPMVATVGALVFAGVTAFVVTLLLPKSPPRLPVHSTAAAVPGSPANPVEMPVLPAKVQIALRSNPAGAQVLQVSDQSLLGTTPWLVERSRGGPPIKVLLRLTGHAEQTLVIELGDNYDRTVQLVPTPSAAASDKTNESVKPPTTKPIAKSPAKPVQRAGSKPAGKPRQDPVDDIPVVR
jgi:serine/threonine-protein kinase